MRYLTERFSGLRSFGPLSLVDAPTPVEEAEALSRASGVSVFVKRDDRTHPTQGGNKVRKLEWLLRQAETRNITDIVTSGGIGSHHVLAAATFAEPLGIRVHGILVPQPDNSYVRSQLARIEKATATHRICSGEVTAGLEMARVMIRLKARGRRPWLIGPGGSSALGTAGFVDAALELAEQVRQGLPAPDAIYVPLGSGGTAAGLALGLSFTELKTEVVAVRVAHRVTTHPRFIGRLIRSTRRWLHGRDPEVPNTDRDAQSRVRVLQSFGGTTYGASTPEGAAAGLLAEQDGLALDPTYTAKSAAALLAHAGRRYGTALLWHTTPGDPAKSRTPL